MANVPTGLDNLKTKVDDLFIGKLKNIPIDLKKLRDVVSKEVVKKTVNNKLNAKVNNLENKIPDASKLIQVNQYNTDKKNLEKNVGDVDKKYRMLVV